MLITIAVVAFVVLLIAYLFISIIFKAQLLMTPCELCVEAQPYLKQCFAQQMGYAQVLNGTVINISEVFRG